jgi:uncharacterized protein (DUF1810 family)
MESPPSDLERFVAAQQFDYAIALAELTAGRKESHWIWYVLPQLRGLGSSPNAHEFGIAGRSEALAYLAHPLLGPRLLTCVRATLVHRDESIEDLLGELDALKFRSCLTLFEAVAPQELLFAEALTTFYGGQRDAATLRLLDAESA